MAWVKLDDQFPDHPKIVAAGAEAAWMYVVALCYSNRMMTDGFIPQNQVSRLVSSVSDNQLVERLIEVGLWEVRTRPAGYYIHDYLIYQPSRSQILKERQAARARMAASRADSGSPELHPNNNGTSPAPVPVPVPFSDPSVLLKEKEQASSTGKAALRAISHAQKERNARHAAARAMDRPWQKDKRHGVHRPR
jgi:hypothetical protein